MERLPVRLFGCFIGDRYRPCNSMSLLDHLKWRQGNRKRYRWTIIVAILRGFLLEVHSFMYILRSFMFHVVIICGYHFQISWEIDTL